ncbi:hypothetical protein [Chryseobacterium sp. SIMBA_029]|uniref:hypothetical protein n=1 Tax=Chryseobacterium sp. SIMBA_029 TaxID=3085772 RepID=UPI00397DABBD
MDLVYTITSGYLECQNEIIDLSFALVFLENGVYKIETLLTDNSIYEKNGFNHYYKIVGLTEKKYRIECHNLFLTKHEGSNNKVTFICDDYIKLHTPARALYEGEEKEVEKKQNIWYVELENFTTKFANSTKTKKFINGIESDDSFFDFTFDHTETSWVIDGLEGNGNYFKFKLIQNKNSENVLIDFRNHKERRNRCILYYEDYLKIKQELICILSFINGAKVKVRKEYIGRYHGQNNNRYTSEVEINYSFENKNDDHYNDYIPINTHNSFSDEIFREIFFRSFVKFQRINKILDLESLIFSLNVSSQTIGIEERYFILITAFERIAKKYSNYITVESTGMIDEDTFSKDIKPNLIKAILPVKNIDEASWSRMNAVISNLNINHTSTNKSLTNFLEYAKIPINKNVKSLIKRERNLAVHEGIVGKSHDEMYQNYLKLDHILRDCILNLIEYFSHRNRRYMYATKEEFENSNPKNYTKDVDSYDIR